MSNSKKGFTLLELIVAMAIFAVLVGLSVIGIQTVQRSQRNTERRSGASQVNLEINAYFADFGVYPGLSLAENGTATFASTGKPSRNATLRGNAIPVDATALAATETGTQYCYSTDGKQYRLGYKVEGETSFSITEFGTPSTYTTCTGLTAAP